MPSINSGRALARNGGDRGSAGSWIPGTVVRSAPAQEGLAEGPGGDACAGCHHTRWPRVSAASAWAGRSLDAEEASLTRSGFDAGRNRTRPGEERPEAQVNPFASRKLPQGSSTYRMPNHFEFDVEGACALARRR